MDATELAKTMLEWQEAQAKADLLKMDIEAAVLELGKTQTVGNVRASYSAGRKSYDYRKVIEDALEHNLLLPQAVEVFAETKIDYTAACKAFGFKDIPFTQSAPSVSLKIVA